MFRLALIIRLKIGVAVDLVEQEDQHLDGVLG